MINMDEANEMLVMIDTDPGFEGSSVIIYIQIDIAPEMFSTE